MKEVNHILSIQLEKLVGLGTHVNAQITQTLNFEYA